MIIAKHELVATPWPNGQGLTRNVAEKRFPTGESDWLISIADLVGNADFSYFEHCDRVFTLIGNEGVDLAIGSAPPLPCFPLVPVFFCGDLVTRCHVQRPTRAFNVFMTRGGTVLEASVHTVAARHCLWRARKLVAIHCVSGEIRAGADLLRQGDTSIEPETREILAGVAGAVLILVEAAV